MGKLADSGYLPREHYRLKVMGTVATLVVKRTEHRHLKMVARLHPISKSRCRRTFSRDQFCDARMEKGERGRPCSILSRNEVTTLDRIVTWLMV